MIFLATLCFSPCKLRPYHRAYEDVKGVCKDGTRLFSIMPSDRTRGNGHKLKCSRVCLNIRKHFSGRMSEHHYRLCREIVEAPPPPPEILKKSPRHSPVQLALGVPTWQAWLNQMTSRIPFLAEPFCDFMIPSFFQKSGKTFEYFHIYPQYRLLKLSFL